MKSSVDIKKGKEGTDSGDTATWGQVQVDRSHYFNSQYLSEARFRGLRAQVHSCLEFGTDKSFLEIGVGPGLLHAIMRHIGYSMVTVDFDQALIPDVVARLPELSFKPNAFDVVHAFEVLEHIPFSLLGPSFAELARVAKEAVIVSVPSQQEIDAGRISLAIEVGKRRWRGTIWRKKLNRLTNPDEHYWELGHDGITVQKILSTALGNNLVPTDNYFASPWFHIFKFGVMP